MDVQDKSSRYLDFLWLLTFGLLSSAWCFSAARELGPTFDETTYLRWGLDRWHTGSYGPLLRMGTMPLPIDVATLPLHLWEKGTGQHFDVENDLALILPWARAGTLLFWWVLLIYGMLIGRHLAGPWGGRLAVTLLALEPNLLAHASLATTDLATVACLLGLLYHFRIGRQGSWFRRIGVPAFWFTLCFLSKASGPVYALMAMVLLEAERLYRDGSWMPWPIYSWKDLWFETWKQFRPLRRDLTRIAGFGLVVGFLYCGCDGKPEPSFVAWAYGLPEGQTRHWMVWLSENLCIFSNAGEALIRQVKHNFKGHQAYLLGETTLKWWWYYFPVLLAIKLPLVLLGGFLAMFLFSPRAALNWALLLALFFLVASLNFKVQTGIRMVLPLVALALIGLAAAIVQMAIAWGPGWRRQTLLLGLTTGCLWLGFSSIRVWPHGLCYTNELWGNTRTGYLYVSDSNYDWGQGVPELLRWQERHGHAPLDVWYFGRDPRAMQGDLRYLQLQDVPLVDPADLVNWVQGRYLAVSTTMLYGGYDYKGKKTTEFLRSLTPVDRTSTFLIFDLGQVFPEVAARFTPEKI